MREALHVVGGPEERRGAAELAGAFETYHGTLHELKQLEPQLDELFDTLRKAQAVLKGHGVRVTAEFEAPMQSALERWRQTRPQTELAVPAFIEGNRE